MATTNQLQVPTNPSQYKKRPKGSSKCNEQTDGVRTERESFIMQFVDHYEQYEQLD